MCIPVPGQCVRSMMAVEYDDGDTEELIAPAVLSIEPGTPVIESQESYWNKEWKRNILFRILFYAFKDIFNFLSYYKLFCVIFYLGPFNIIKTKVLEMLTFIIFIAFNHTVLKPQLFSEWKISSTGDWVCLCTRGRGIEFSLRNRCRGKELPLRPIKREERVKISPWSVLRNVFTNMSHIWWRFFSESSKQLKAVNYFCQENSITDVLRSSISDSLFQARKL